MTVFGRMIFTVSLTVLAAILFLSGFDSKHFTFAAGLVILFAALPTVLFATLILWPVEAALRRVGFGAAITIIAPALGFFGPYILLAVAPNYDNAMAAIAFWRWHGLVCGVAWATSFLLAAVVTRRKSPPRVL
jgi:hypothetical protein